MVALAQADAKRHFLTVCRRAIEAGERVYVKDKGGRPYLTLDPDGKRLSGPAVKVAAQFFKDNFSRCSSLIKDGLCFELRLKGADQTVFARRHTKYFDSCDVVIEKWRSQVVDAAIAEKQEADLVRLIGSVDRKTDAGHQTILDAIATLKVGVARLAIGHRPFEVGQMPNDG